MCSWRIAFGLGSLIRYMVLVVVAVRLRLALDTEEVLSGTVDSDIHLFVADVIKSFDYN